MTKVAANADAGGNAGPDVDHNPPFAQRAPLCTCGDCRHATAGGAAMEQWLPGLRTLGSGLGSSIGASRLCRLHDQLVDPQDDCPQFSRDR